jgi:hypothetical protein
MLNPWANISIAALSLLDVMFVQLACLVRRGS